VSPSGAQRALDVLGQIAEALGLDVLAILAALASLAGSSSPHRRP